MVRGLVEARPTRELGEERSASKYVALRPSRTGVDASEGKETSSPNWSGYRMLKVTGAERGM